MPAKDTSKKVNQVSSTKTLRDVCVPFKLFNEQIVDLLDTRCDTSVFGARLVPKGTPVQPTMNHFSCQRTKIPLTGELKVRFKVAGKEQFVFVAVTEAVNDFILGINFLSDKRCQWDFFSSCILLGNDWVLLWKRSTTDEARHIYICKDYCLPPGMQADVLVLVTWSDLQAMLEPCMAEPTEIVDGVLMAHDTVRWQHSEVSCLHHQPVRLTV